MHVKTICEICKCFISLFMKSPKTLNVIIFWIYKPWSQTWKKVFILWLIISEKITSSLRSEMFLFKEKRKQPVMEGSNWTWAWTVCFWWGVDWVRPQASAVWLMVRNTTPGWQVKHNSFQQNELFTKYSSVHPTTFFQPVVPQLCTCAKHQRCGKCKNWIPYIYVRWWCHDWI